MRKLSPRMVVKSLGILWLSYPYRNNPIGHGRLDVIHAQTPISQEFSSPQDAQIRACAQAWNLVRMPPRQESQDGLAVFCKLTCYPP